MIIFLNKTHCTIQSLFWLYINMTVNFLSHFLSLVRNGKGVFISDVVKGGAADLDGRLMQGDQILSVDGEDMRQASQESVAAILKVCSTSILKPKAQFTTLSKSAFHEQT